MRPAHNIFLQAGALVLRAPALAAGGFDPSQATLVYHPGGLWPPQPAIAKRH
jgi:hypothetical protein